MDQRNDHGGDAPPRPRGAGILTVVGWTLGLPALLVALALAFRAWALHEPWKAAFADLERRAPGDPEVLLYRGLRDKDMAALEAAVLGSRDPRHAWLWTGAALRAGDHGASPDVDRALRFWREPENGLIAEAKRTIASAKVRLHAEELHDACATIDSSCERIMALGRGATVPAMVGLVDVMLETPEDFGPPASPGAAPPEALLALLASAPLDQDGREIDVMAAVALPLSRYGRRAREAVARLPAIGLRERWRGALPALVDPEDEPARTLLREAFESHDAHGAGGPFHAIAAWRTRDAALLPRIMALLDPRYSDVVQLVALDRARRAFDDEPPAAGKRE